MKIRLIVMLWRLICRNITTFFIVICVMYIAVFITTLLCKLIYGLNLLPL